MTLERGSLWENSTAIAAYVSKASPNVVLGEAIPCAPLRQSQTNAILAVDRAYRALEQGNKCARCALLRTSCICSSLDALRSKVMLAVGPARRLRFAIWMHPRERYRATNTGKLIYHVLPECEIFLHEVPEDEARFEQALSAVNGQAFILFPSADALPVSAIPEAKPCNEGSSSSSILVLLVDGTWAQAKNMHKRLAAFPHIALSTTTPSAFRGRTQSQDGRVSTVEAAALLLQEIEPVNLELPAALHEALGILDAALEEQQHYCRTDPHWDRIPSRSEAESEM